MLNDFEDTYVKFSKLYKNAGDKFLTEIAAHLGQRSRIGVIF